MTRAEAEDINLGAISLRMVNEAISMDGIIQEECKVRRGGERREGRRLKSEP